MQYNFVMIPVINPENSAYDGARTMFVPVFTAAITTVAAFIPIFLISGIIGQVIEAIPLVAIGCFNCFFN